MTELGVPGGSMTVRKKSAGTWEPSLPEAKEADLFPWYEYYDVNAR